MICAECLRCANYMVSEVGCYGSSSPCNSEIEVEYEDEEGEQNEEKGNSLRYSTGRSCEWLVTMRLEDWMEIYANRID